MLENLVLTGLRGVGKTVLLDAFRPIASQCGWLWVGTDLSQSTSIDEERLALRLLTDLSTATSGLVLGAPERRRIGFESSATSESITLGYDALERIHTSTPGLVADEFRAVLEIAWQMLQASENPCRGVIFAYDEAQNMADHPAKDQFPLSLLLDLFQSIQKATRGESRSPRSRGSSTVTFSPEGGLGSPTGNGSCSSSLPVWTARTTSSPCRRSSRDRRGTWRNRSAAAT